MGVRRKHLPLLIGAVSSILLHGSVIVPALMATVTASGARLRPEARFERPVLRPPDEPEEEPAPPEPGIDTPTPRSTLTWIGYEEYEEHLAQRAEFEQAAFTMQEAAEPGDLAPLAEAAAPRDPTPPAEEPTPEESPPDPATPAPDSLVALATTFEHLRQLAEAVATTAPPVAPTDPPPATEPTPTTPTEPSPPAETAPEKPKEAPKPVEPGTEPKPAETPPGQPKAEPGEQSDRESPATSLLDVDLSEIKLGKPVAREGIELFPKEPRFTTLTRLTVLPANPRVAIFFDRDGIPIDARIMVSSGSSTVDAAVESSLFRWRARGAKLEGIGPDERVEIRIRIVLNPRAP